MLIPVEVQKPNQPHTARIVGMQSDDLTAEEVAERVGVPQGCLIDGKVMSRNGKKRWSLVATVRFVEQVDPTICPHCGGEL